MNTFYLQWDITNKCNNQLTDNPQSFELPEKCRECKQLGKCQKYRAMAILANSNQFEQNPQCSEPTKGDENNSED